MKLKFSGLTAIGLGIAVLQGQNEDVYSSSYVIEWANDTIAIETFTLIDNHMFGKVIHGFPENHIRHFDIEFAENGSISHLDYTYYDLENTSIALSSKTGLLPYRSTAHSSENILKYLIVDSPKPPENPESAIKHVPVKQFNLKTDGFHFNGGWIPIVSQFEWLVKLFHQQNEERLDNLKFVNPYIGVHDLYLKRLGGNHLQFWSNISEGIDIYLDRENKIDSINAIGSVWNFKIKRAPKPLDIEDYRQQFLKRPTIGNPSPRESIKKNINGTSIILDYGRPSMRGRKIFGHIVPYNTVWRTGAGGPTTLEFDNDLIFNNTKVAAGKYNVYSLPTENGFVLILNSSLESWGSVHLPEFNIARISMKYSELPLPVEKFTATLIERETEGELRFQWENTLATVKFRRSN